MLTCLRHEVRTARKPHNCVGCWGRIERGEKYVNEGWTEGGGVWTVKLCDHCVWVLQNSFMEEWHGGELGELHDNMPPRPENWEVT